MFQVFCCVLWSLDEYWVYSAFTLVMLLLFEATLCIQRLRNLEQLRSMRRPARLLYAYRQKKWRPTMSDDLVPGDVIALSTQSAEGPDTGALRLFIARRFCGCE